MEIKQVHFTSSSAQLSSMPKPNLPEYAFVGRSNVGKSSLINALCKRKELAHTSSTPGKTKTVNHFLVDEEWYLADLPGYGYAKVSKSDRVKFSGLIRDYITKRENLMCVFVLVDSRISPQALDLEFIEFLGINNIPLAIIFTKTDKLNQSETTKNRKVFEERLLEVWEELPVCLNTSAVSGAGMEQLLDYVRSTFKNFERR